MVDEVERWCFACRSHYPHQEVDGLGRTPGEIVIGGSVELVVDGSVEVVLVGAVVVVVAAVGGRGRSSRRSTSSSSSSTDVDGREVRVQHPAGERLGVAKLPTSTPSVARLMNFCQISPGTSRR